ncbi:MAG: hypothetical protein HZA25_01445 [Candidatus Niyogibacteria bacterium]|nr:hypothetical protein [Candidatus Niyogibacteria bacterium]
MPPRSNKTIWMMYAAVLGGFVYALFSIVAGRSVGSSAVSGTVATKVNDTLVERRNSLLEQSRQAMINRQLELQQSAFRAEAAAKAQAASASQTTAPATPTYTPPAPTYVPPTPVYVRPRTTIS